MTKTYTAYFYTDANYASTEIEADTPEQALAAARKLDEEESGDLYYEHYDEGMLVNHIEILDEDRNELAHWRDDDLLLRRAAPDMLDALKAQEMANADPEASRRKGYFDTARDMRRAALAKAEGK